MKNIKYVELTREETKKLKKGKKAPYFYSYGKKRKISCLGVKHTKNPRDKQIRLAKKIIDEKKPWAVLLETNDKSLEKMKFLINKKTKIKDLKEIYFSEKYAVAKAAINKGIDLVAADMSIYKIRYEEIGNEFSRDDFFCCKFIFLMKALSKKGKSPKKILFSSEKIKNHPRRKEIISKIRKYLKETTGKKLEELSYKDNFVPTPMEDKCVLNDISKKIHDYLRNMNMLEVIKRERKFRKNIFFMAGNSHIVLLEPYIKKLYEER